GADGVLHGDAAAVVGRRVAVDDDVVDGQAGVALVPDGAAAAQGRGVGQGGVIDRVAAGDGDGLRGGGTARQGHRERLGTGRDSGGLRGGAEEVGVDVEDAVDAVAVDGDGAAAVVLDGQVGRGEDGEGAPAVVARVAARAGDLV